MAKTQHAVFIKIKPQCGESEIQALFAALKDLKTKIPGILEYSGGPNRSPEGLSRGYTHGFVMTFESEAARDAYLPHPDHLAVVDLIIPMLGGGLEGGVIVLDWALED